MGRDAGGVIRVSTGRCGHSAVMQRGKPLRVIAKALLTARQRAPVTSAELVEDRQQGQPDARRLCRRNDPLGHLGQVGIRLSADIVVQVVKFGDRGISRFQHLHENQCGDCFDMVGVKLVQKAIHQLRHVQKLSRGSGPRASVRPAIARWKAWLCRLTGAGSSKVHPV